MTKPDNQTLYSWSWWYAWSTQIVTQVMSTVSSTRFGQNFTYKNIKISPPHKKQHWGMINSRLNDAIGALDRLPKFPPKSMAIKDRPVWGGGREGAVPVPSFLYECWFLVLGIACRIRFASSESVWIICLIILLCLYFLFGYWLMQ